MEVTVCDPRTCYASDELNFGRESPLVPIIRVIQSFPWHIFDKYFPGAPKANWSTKSLSMGFLIEITLIFCALQNVLDCLSDFRRSHSHVCVLKGSLDLYAAQTVAHMFVCIIESGILQHSHIVY